MSFGPGADNTNHFFALSSDLFDPTKTQLGVTAPALWVHRPFAAGGNANSTYDRYTFYRLLAQLGTDSSPESGKMNLNYDNLNPYRNGVLDVNNGVASVTNFIPWTPIAFFTNAADRMLRVYTTNWFQADPSNYLATYYGLHTNYFYIDGSGNIHTNDQTGLGLVNLPFFGMTNQIPAFGVTNIPVYVNGQYVYSSAMQRVLQLAANIYDSMYYTNNYFPLAGSSSSAYLPSLFQPVFNKVVNGTGWNVYINSFRELNGNLAYGSTIIASTTPSLGGYLYDLDNATDLANLQPYNFVYGVPIIVGAKKGFPNFNAFSLQSSFQITRKVELTRTSTNTPVKDFGINQMFNCSVSNLLAMESWNSYFTNYTRPTTIYMADHFQMALTNDQIPASQIWPSADYYLYATTNIVNWTGIGAQMNTASFQFANFNTNALPPASYLFNTTYFGYHFQPITNATASPNFEINPNGLPQPRWGLLATNNLQVVMIDNASGRVIDYVQLRGPITGRDLTAQIQSESSKQAPSSVWQTNSVLSATLPPQTLPAGVENQLYDSTHYASSLWPTGQNPAQPGGTYDQMNGLLRFLGDTAIYPSSGGFYATYGATNLQIQSAYTPTATAVQIITWQANDPLVHYLASDLFDSADGERHQRHCPHSPGILGQPITLPAVGRKSKTKPIQARGCQKGAFKNSRSKIRWCGGRTFGIFRRINSRRSAGWAGCIAARRGRRFISRHQYSD